MPDMKPVSVPMRPADLWRLESVAERRGLTLPEFLYKSALAVAGASAPKGKESIVIFHDAGMTVPEIARRLDMTNTSVRERLVRLGLKPNTTKTKARNAA